jgi:hypothetical protein
MQKDDDMQEKQLKKMLSRVVIATSFALVALAPFNAVRADSNVLESVQGNTQDMLEFLDKNSTAPSEFETKTIKLGYKDDENELYSKERYRKRDRRSRKKATVISKDGKKNIVAVVEKAELTDKSPLSISNGDYALTFGGSTKIEHIFQRNMALLNKSLPDESEFFKNTFDFTTNFAYGEKRFGHKAIEANLDIMHKGYWGKNGLVADSEPSTPTQLKLSDTFFGEHSHQNGRPFMWIREGWLKFSLNAITNAHATPSAHTLKIGWFPFDLGRGIALGSAFGLNSDLLGIYSYAEEKAAAGINLNGELVKDVVGYDLYFARFEERNKGLRDTSSVVRKSYTAPGVNPWRGLGKDNDVLAGRLKIKPLPKGGSNCLELEPYVMYNTAPDQRVDIVADSNTSLGSYGLSVEHCYNNFEIGGEVAFNFGKTEMIGIDKNSTEVFRDVDGKLGERYTKIVSPDIVPGKLTKVVRSTAVDGVVGQLNASAPNAVVAAGGINIQSAADRYRTAYTNTYGGWMGVLDAAYNFKEAKTKLALGGGYASGDGDPDREQKSKTYKGFVGLNEIYSGKRIKSVIVLDERVLQRPVILSTAGNIEASKDLSFTDLAFGGMSAVWTPNLLNKKWTINSNGLLFWKAYQENKPNVAKDGTATLTDQKASKFMGTELNLLTRVELLKDFCLFANLGVFVPGGYFKDFSGIALGKDEFIKAFDDIATVADVKDYRLKSDNAYHMNIGFSYKF